MSEPMTPLYALVHHWTSVPHVWGQSDCITVLADWVQVQTGVDPMPELRGTYVDAASCQAATGFLRDPVAVIGAGLARVGIERGNSLQAGDVAVLRRRDSPAMPIGGLWLGTCWACKGPGGVTTLHPHLVEVQAFWSVGYEA